MAAVLHEPHGVAGDVPLRHAGRLAADRQHQLTAGGAWARAIPHDHIAVAELVRDLLVGEPDIAPAGWGQRRRLAPARDAMQRQADRGDPQAIEAGWPRG